MGDREFGVLVAVGPAGVGDGVLGFAAAEAERLGTGVELLHVVHSTVVVPAAEEQVQRIDRSLTTVGQRVLTDAATRLRDRAGGRVPVSTEVLTGLVSATIASRAAGADLVVVERREARRVERLLTMSISTHVAARASAPVVVVPRGWSASDAEDLPVTAGVDHPLEAAGQVESAAAYARSAGRALVAMHAVWLAEPYQDLVFLDHGRGDWLRDATTQLEQGLAKLPDRDTLELTIDVRWDRPAEALVAASAESALLVLSRRDDRHLLGGHLGGTTRTVLQHARCPVLVTDRT